MVKDLGVVYFQQGRYNKAFRYYAQALSLIRSSGDLREEGYVLNDIGHVYEVLGKKDKANKYYREALPLGRTTDDRSLEVVILHNIARLERTQGDLDAALASIEAAISITEGVRSAFLVWSFAPLSRL